MDSSFLLWPSGVSAGVLADNMDISKSHMRAAQLSLFSFGDLRVTLENLVDTSVTAALRYGIAKFKGARSDLYCTPRRLATSALSCAHDNAGQKQTL